MIKLRPHHIGWLIEELNCRAAHEQARDNPDSLDLKSYLRAAARHKEILRDIYQRSAVDFTTGVLNSICSSPDQTVLLVDGQDDICKNCVFYDKCRVKDYDFVRNAWKECGISLPTGANPDSADEQDVLKFGLVVGKKYSARELFSI